MAKNQTSYATNASNNLMNQAQGLTAPIMSGFQSAQNTQTANQQSQESAAQGGIASSQSTGGYDPSQLVNLRGETQNLATTGGFDPTQTATLNAGGYSPEQLANLTSAQSGYQTMASTGGYTPQQANQFLQQATEGTTDTYNTLAQQAKQSIDKSGGEGSAGAIAQMARQLGQAQGTNTVNALTSLNQQENANKFQGLGGLASTASTVAGQTMAGQGMLASGKQQGVAQQTGLESNVAAGKNTANQQMSQLYNTTTGQVTALGQQVLSSLGLDFSTQEAATASLTQLSKNPGLLSTILGDISGLGGAAAGAAGSLGVRA